MVSESGIIPMYMYIMTECFYVLYYVCTSSIGRVVYYNILKAVYLFVVGELLFIFVKLCTYIYAYLPLSCNGCLTQPLAC